MQTFNLANYVFGRGGVVHLRRVSGDLSETQGVAPLLMVLPDVL